MLGLRRQSRTNKVKDALIQAASYGDELARDGRLRSDIRSAVGHGVAVTDRVRQDVSAARITSRLARDRKLRRNLRALLDDLESATERVQRRRSHRVRNMLLLLGGTGVVVAAVPDTRRWIANLASSQNGGPPAVAATE
jgi:uncharacterized NAD-dependent epimerase/dehydratase family protein